jgi:hypothetical protein
MPKLLWVASSGEKSLGFAFDEGPLFVKVRVVGDRDETLQILNEVNRLISIANKTEKTGE